MEVFLHQIIFKGEDDLPDDLSDRKEERKDVEESMELQKLCDKSDP